jgi:hypothetical protein
MQYDGTDLHRSSLVHIRSSKIQLNAELTEATGSRVTVTEWPGCAKRHRCFGSFNPLKPNFRGGRKSIILVEGSQAMLARPSGRSNVKVKTLWW